MTDIVLSAGEASGDDLGAALINEIKRLRPTIKIAGIGGEKMRRAGMELIVETAPPAVMGYWDVLRRLPSILASRRRLITYLEKHRPPVFIGIDAPDFNLAVAKRARRLQSYTVQYTSPSIWMWRKNRLNKIRRAVCEVWCLFPFEPAHYENSGVTATFVGHPEARLPLVDKKEARKKLGIDGDVFCVAVFAGSRLPELRQHLPLLQKVIPHFNQVQFAAAATNKQTAAMIGGALKNVKVITGDSQTTLAAADIALVKSGTASLQAAMMKKPMIIFYKMSTPSYFLAAKWRRFALPFFALPNILGGRFVAAELLQNEADEKLLTETIRALINDENKRLAMAETFAEMRRQLAPDDGMKTAIKRILAQC